MNNSVFLAGNKQKEFIEVTASGGSYSVHCIGRTSLLLAADDLRGKLKAKLPIPPPSGRDPAMVLMREIVAKLSGEWKFPYDQEELCHCRCVPTTVVDQAIIEGADTPEKVSEQTSASTACGTCRFDVEAILAYRRP